MSFLSGSEHGSANPKTQPIANGEKLHWTGKSQGVQAPKPIVPRICGIYRVRSVETENLLKKIISIYGGIVVFVGICCKTSKGRFCN